MKTIKIALYILIALGALCGGSSCVHTQSGNDKAADAQVADAGIADTGVADAQAADTQTEKAFAPPEVPLMLTSPESRAAYLVSHYWDNFDFTDTTLIAKSEITEQALANFLHLLPRVSLADSGKALKGLMNAASADSTMFVHFVKLTERYLYDPNSPLRNEEYYIQVLDYLVSSPKLDDVHKLRPQHQLKQAMKNRPGDIATDFRYTTADGTIARMSAIKADYTVLFFNNPDCRDCRRVKDFIKHSEIFNRLSKAKSVPSLRVLAVYPDEDVSLWKRAEYPEIMINSYDAQQAVMKQELYDLKAIPTFYLLDKDKRVILKDAPVEKVEGWLKKLLNMGRE